MADEILIETAEELHKAEARAEALSEACEILTARAEAAEANRVPKSWLEDALRHEREAEARAEAAEKRRDTLKEKWDEAERLCGVACEERNEAEAELKAAEKRAEEWEAALAAMYRDEPYAISRLCDEFLDRRGALLGRVRKAALSQPQEQGRVDQWSIGTVGFPQPQEQEDRDA